MGRGLKVAVVALALSASGARGQTTAFDEIPGVTIAYYDVTGTDQATIRAAMLKARPTDPNDGRRVDALTRTALTWYWPVRDGECQLREAAVTFSATVTLPRLTNAATVPDSVRAAWATHLARLEAHELAHLRYGYDGRLDVLAAIQAATCDTANGAAQAALARIQQRDVAFDRATDHGETDAGSLTLLSPAKAGAQ